MKSNQYKEEILEKFYDTIIDFQLLGMNPVQNIMNYLDSPGLYKFFDKRFIKFHPLDCHNFDEAEQSKDIKSVKFIKWIHINLADFLKLNDKFREIEKKVYEVLVKIADNDNLYDEISKLICEMRIILKRLEEHRIQIVDSKLIETREMLLELKVDETHLEQYVLFHLNNEGTNQDFIDSIIELYPEILDTNIEDIKKYFSEDYYFNLENKTMELILNKMEELK